MKEPNLVDNPFEISSQIHKESRIVFEQFDYSFRQVVQPNLDKFQAGYEAYRSYVEESDVASGIFRPSIFASIESILPRLAANQPRIEVWGREPADELRAAANRQLLFYDWDVMKMILKSIAWAKSALIYGIGWVKVYHRKERHSRLVRVPTDVANNILGFQIPAFGSSGIGRRLSRVRAPVTVYDDPEMLVLDPDEVFPDPDARDLDTLDWVIHRFPTNIHTLEAAEYDGKPLYKKRILSRLKKSIHNLNPIEFGRYESLRRRRADTFDTGGTREYTSDPTKQQVHVLEKITNGKIISVIEEFPQLPPIAMIPNDYGMINLSGYTPTLLPGEIAGLSHPEILYSLAMETNTLASARMDSTLQQVYPMHEIDANAGINPDDITWRPRGWYYSNVPNGVRQVAPPRLDFTPYREMDDLRMWMQLAGGDTDIFRGLSSNLTGGTATEASLLFEASGSRVGLMFQIFGLQALNRLGRILIRINEGTISNTRKLRILGEDFSDIFPSNRVQRTGSENNPRETYLTIEPEDLYSRTGLDLDLKIDIAANEPATRQARFNQAMLALQTLGNILPGNHPFMEENIANLGRGMGFERADKLVNDPEARRLAETFAQARRAPLTRQAQSSSLVGA